MEGEPKCAGWVWVTEFEEGPEFIVGQNRTSDCFHAAKWQTQFCI